MASVESVLPGRLYLHSEKCFHTYATHLHLFILLHLAEEVVRGGCIFAQENQVRLTPYAHQCQHRRGVITLQVFAESTVQSHIKSIMRRLGCVQGF